MDINYSPGLTLFFFVRGVTSDQNMSSDTFTDIKGGKGGIDALHVADIEKPTPTATQALVRVKAFGLNRMDLLQREGKYPLPPQAPKTLGVEFSGVIEGFGNDAERGFAIGDEVFGLAYGGMAFPWSISIPNWGSSSWEMIFEFAAWLAFWLCGLLTGMMHDRCIC